MTPLPEETKRRFTAEVAEVTEADNWNILIVLCGESTYRGEVLCGQSGDLRVVFV